MTRIAGMVLVTAIYLASVIVAGSVTGSENVAAMVAILGALVTGGALTGIYFEGERR